ncbi:MAG: hypothetical protein QOI38_2106, partial [Sphingomonadales bacterium]|nr:hypothetical protein [Sphingomonadales bacterium]
GDEALDLALDAAELAAAAPASITVRPPRPHAPTEEELLRHAAFLSGLADPIWHRLTESRDGA